MVGNDRFSCPACATHSGSRSPVSLHALCRGAAANRAVGLWPAGREQSRKVDIPNRNDCSLRAPCSGTRRDRDADLPGHPRARVLPAVLATAQKVEVAGHRCSNSFAHLRDCVYRERARPGLAGYGRCGHRISGDDVERCR